MGGALVMEAEGMNDVVSIFQALEAGGNAALVFFAWVLWRLERRVYRLELKTGEGDVTATSANP